MRRLLRAVRDLAACRDVAGVVEVVRVAARNLVDADGATFVLRDGGKCHYVDEGAIEPLWRGQRFPLDGRGVPEAKRETIFEMFRRGTASSGQAGSGIGLAFSRRVVERHGGTLEVDDAPGGGARFTVRLPLHGSED